jgi:hypothetical protein
LTYGISLYPTTLQEYTLMINKINIVILNNTPLFHYLSTFLCASSILSLHDTNHQCHWLCQQLKSNKIFTQRINNALLARGFDPIQFNQALLQSQCKLSGSFILQSINNEPWQANDLDLYYSLNNLNTTYWSSMDNYLWEMCGREDHKYIKGHSYMQEAHDCHSLFHSIHSYRVNPETAVQCIRLESQFQNLDEFITTKYDWDFLKNTFDGQSVTLHRIQSLLHRTSVYHVNSDQGKLCHIQRILKYQRRGYIALNYNVRSFVVHEDIRLREYSLNNNSEIGPLGFGIHRDDIVKALTFTSAYSHLKPLKQRFNMDLIPKYQTNFFDDGFLYLPELFNIIHAQIGRTYNLEEHRAFQALFNARFNSYYNFQFVR